MRMPRVAGLVLALFVLLTALAFSRLGDLAVAPAAFLGAGAMCLIAVAVRDATTPQARMTVVHGWGAATALFLSAGLAAKIDGEGLFSVLLGVVLAAVAGAGAVWSHKLSRRRRRSAIFDGYLTR